MSRRPIAIDLTWVRHEKVGGTESFARNLLDGFAKLSADDIEWVLLLTRDNADSFSSYGENPSFTLQICDVNSASQKERVLWQNFRMGKLLRSLGIKTCLEPVYGKPILGVRGIQFVTVIHDLQAKHFPQYFSKGRVAWMKLMWRNAVKTSKVIVTTSEYVKQDIASTYQGSEKKIQIIYIPVVIDTKRDETKELDTLSQMKLSDGQYYYTVSSQFLHKNLKTIVQTIAELKNRGSKAYYPLVVSGIGGRRRDELDALISELGVEEDIIFTAFVDNATRNTLYKHAKAFLFPSIFEGFGIPPLEAMELGTPVLTTKCTSIPEVTGGLLNYVEDPLDPVEWANRLETELQKPTQEQVQALLAKYDAYEKAAEYKEVLLQVET